VLTGYDSYIAAALLPCGSAAGPVFAPAGSDLTLV
jgi:hypothetical protein